MVEEVGLRMQDAGERVGFEQVYDGVRVYPRADAHHFGVEGVDTSDDLRVFKAMLYEEFVDHTHRRDRQGGLIHQAQSLIFPSPQKLQTAS